MKTLFVKTLSVLALCIFVFASVSAQDKPEFSVGADVVSSYVWRGSKVAGYEGVNLQPSASISYSGLSLGAWGSTNYNGAAKEFDLSLSYGIGNASFMVTDYWFGGNYFRYGKSAGAHTLEGTVSYSLGETLPLSLSWNTLFYGADYKDSGSKRYSTYVELAYETSVSDVDLTFALGASPWTSSWYHFDAEGDMKSGFQINNISLTAAKEIKISDSFSLPLFGQIVVNPCQEDINFVVGFSF